MRYLKNYDVFRRLRKSNEGVSYGTKAPIAPSVEEVDVEEGTEMAYSWSSSEDIADKIQVVKDKIEQSDGITMADVLSGIATGAGIVGGAFGVKYIASKFTGGGGKGKKEKKYRSLYGSTDPDYCYNSVLKEFGLRDTGARYYEGTVGDLLKAIEDGNDASILVNFKPSSVIPTKGVRMLYAYEDNPTDKSAPKVKVPLPDYLNVGGKIMDGRIVFSLLSRGTKIVAAGNGLLGLTRLVRGAKSNPAPADQQPEVYQTGIVEEAKAWRDGIKLVFGPSSDSLIQSCKLIGETIEVASWNIKEYTGFMATKVQSDRGRYYVPSPDGKKLYITSEDGRPLDSNSVISSIMRSSRANIAFKGDKTKLMFLKENLKGANEELKQNLKSKFMFMHAEIIPPSLYDDKIENFPGYYDVISKKLGFVEIPETDIEGWIAQYKSFIPSEESNAIFDRIKPYAEEWIKWEAEYSALQQSVANNKGGTKEQLAKLKNDEPKAWYPPTEVLTLKPGVDEFLQKVNTKVIEMYKKNYEKVMNHLMDEVSAKDAVAELNEIISSNQVPVAGQKAVRFMTDWGKAGKTLDTEKDETDVSIGKQSFEKGK